MLAISIFNLYYEVGLNMEKTTEIAYENLTYEMLLEANPNILKVIKNDVAFYFKLKLKSVSDKIVLFSNGAYDPTKSTPPIFSRSSWHSDFDANCVFIDDVTIHNTECTLGWGVGTPKHYYLKDISEIIIRICEILKIKSLDTVYYGSSAGGFMSIMLSIFHKDATAIVNNPQVYAHKFGKGTHISKLYKTRFPGMSEEEIHEKYGSRFSVTKMMEQFNYIPKVIYIQNRMSLSDMEKQYYSFIKTLDKTGFDSSSIKFLLYSSDKGHEGIYSREETAKLVNAYLNNIL